jgi:hypothetical protein
MILFLCLIIYYVQNFDPIPVVDGRDDRPSQPNTIITNDEKLRGPCF